MKKGKVICNILRQLRIDIATHNKINYVPHECHNENDCLGTCPLCEKELEYLEDMLEKKRHRGEDIIYVSSYFNDKNLNATNREINIEDTDSQKGNSVIEHET